MLDFISHGILFTYDGEQVDGEHHCEYIVCKGPQWMMDIESKWIKVEDLFI